MNDIPATIDLSPSGGQPDASVIWLHGLGADANDFVPIVEQFRALQPVKTRFVFPQAPVRAITVNGGMQMRAWYDIAEISISKTEDSEGIQDSARLIRLLIDREHALGIAHNRIVLAGFSQGGAIALYTGLRFNMTLGGIVALSSYIPLPNTLLSESQMANQNTPIFMAHGLFDPVVPLMLGQMAREQLEGMGYSVEWHSYSMPHSVVPEEIEDIDRFLAKIL